MKLKRVLASALLLATLLTLPARAAQASGAKGEANITPDTPMAKIRSNPSVMGAGLYTYNQEQDTPGISASGKIPPCGSMSTIIPLRTAPRA